MLLRQIISLGSTRKIIRHDCYFSNNFLSLNSLSKLNKRPSFFSTSKLDKSLSISSLGSNLRFLTTTTTAGKNKYAKELAEKNRRVVTYVIAVVVGALGITYASVPLYKVFCQATGFGGTTQRSDAKKAAKMQPVDGSRPIRVSFVSNVSDAMPWKFWPQQNDIKIVPGETALAFYTASNPTDKPITGVATYNVHPPKAGLYFNKIQCFCFEEQRLRPHEEIDMPVFFFIDPDILDDPSMKGVNNITLAYTFFKTDEEESEQIIQQNLQNSKKTQETTSTNQS